MDETVRTCAGCGVRNRFGFLVAEAGKVPRCGRCKSPLPWLIAADEESFGREVGITLPVLVDFWAPWCSPCRAVTPVLEALATEQAGRLKVVKVNVDENPVLVERFRVSSIPTLILLNCGQVAETLVGAQPKAVLMRTLAPYLERHSATAWVN